jgi:hypothetical protein
MKTLTLSIAALLALATAANTARADEPCGRDGRSAPKLVKTGGDCHGAFYPIGFAQPAADSKPMPKGDGPTVVYVTPYIPHPFAAVVHVVRCRMHQAACQAKATVQAVRVKEPMRTFIRNHRPHIRCR